MYDRRRRSHDEKLARKRPQLIAGRYPLPPEEEQSVGRNKLAQSRHRSFQSSKHDCRNCASLFRPTPVPLARRDLKIPLPEPLADQPINLLDLLGPIGATDQGGVGRVDDEHVLAADRGNHVLRVGGSNQRPLGIDQHVPLGGQGVVLARRGGRSRRTSARIRCRAIPAASAPRPRESSHRRVPGIPARRAPSRRNRRSPSATSDRPR